MDNLIKKEENVHKDFCSNFRKILEKTPKSIIKDFNFIHLQGNELPWFNTDIEIEKEDKITVISKGKIYLFEAFDVWVEPHHHLWFRIGERGDIFRGTRNTITFKADRTEKLFLANYPGDWKNKKGDVALGDLEDYKRLEVKGGMSILVIRWTKEPLIALKHLLTIGDFENLIKSEINRLSNSTNAPNKWNYLWSVGNSEIFKQLSKDGHKKCIQCNTKGNAAILQKKVEFPLKPKTNLSWSWKIDKLPTEKAENFLFNHDYMSIAVEFDNGQDITYCWSPKLPIDTIYRCPIRTWNKHETHIVIRTGESGLGEWIKEECNIFEDYKRAIGDPPDKIVGIWLIALSIFQRKEGKCTYTNIELKNDTDSITIM